MTASVKNNKPQINDDSTDWLLLRTKVILSKDLSTMDKTKSPNFIPPINIMRLESLKEGNLYTGDKPLEFVLLGRP